MVWVMDSHLPCSSAFMLYRFMSEHALYTMEQLMLGKFLRLKLKKLIDAYFCNFSSIHPFCCLLKMQVFFALTMMAVGVSQSSSLARDFSKVQDAAASIFKIIDRKSKIDASSDDGMAPKKIEGNIEFQHVSFKYPARTDVQIFTNLCLRIPSGKVHVVLMVKQFVHSSLFS